MTAHSFVMPQELEDTHSLDGDSDIGDLVGRDYAAHATYYDATNVPDIAAVRGVLATHARMLAEFARLHGVRWPQ